MDYVNTPGKSVRPRDSATRRLVNGLFGAWAMASFLVTGLATLLTLLFTPGMDRRRQVVRAAARCLLWLWGTRLEARGLAHLPDQPCVVVANHASYLDGIIMTAVLPPRFAFVIKNEMTRVPLAHFVLRRIGSEFVERFDRQRGALDVRRLLQRALTREGLVFFPEGTFRPEPGLRRFQAGAFAAAVHSRRPVVPAVIRGSRAMLPARQLLPRPGSLVVELLEPLPADPAGQDARTLLEASRTRILARLDEPDAAA
ncbi:MAG: 1-acyl-sn-glycerol-3-phosphate acyltransferase [Chromatiales bacterium]|nr:1-acyl-sn-glycerol-3-phosphate acyltransferase [Chromatiales bacterium]